MLLSIITPTQNRIKFLKKKIRQFDTLYNNFKDFEWILVTEKNDLKTKSFIKSIKRKYLKVIIGNFNSAELAFAKGFKLSKGKYINFHGDDDFLNTKKIKFLNKKIFLENHEWIIYEGEYINEEFVITRKIITYIKSFLLKSYGLLDLTIVNYIMTPSVFVRRNIFLKVGGLGKAKRSGSDYVLWIKLNNLYKPKIYNHKLTYSMLTHKTITGTFEMDKYIYIFKQMMNNNNGILSKFLIIASISCTIIYNFISKKKN